MMIYYYSPALHCILFVKYKSSQRYTFIFKIRFITLLNSHLQYSKLEHFKIADQAYYSRNPILLRAHCQNKLLLDQCQVLLYRFSF